MSWPHEELTQRIIGICFQIQDELGHGFVESVYHSALLIALRQEGLKVDSKRPTKIEFRGQIVGTFQPDIVVNDTVLVEVKAVRALAPEHQAQVINYLRATRIEVGLLINFGRPRIELRRLHI
jgi:GxxExxY protein